jgi:uncharacterized protein (DUF302 family)
MKVRQNLELEIYYSLEESEQINELIEAKKKEGFKVTSNLEAHEGIKGILKIRQSKRIEE